MDTESWISAPFHVLQNVILLFSLLFKNVKAILSFWTVQELPAGWLDPWVQLASLGLTAASLLDPAERLCCGHFCVLEPTGWMNEFIDLHSACAQKQNNH